MKKENVLRASIFLVCIFILVIYILKVRYQIIQNLNQEVVNVVNEYKKNGKPVVVREIVEGDIDVFFKITILPVGDGLFESYVTKGIKSELSLGQILYYQENDLRRFGKISFVSGGRDTGSGLFRIESIFDYKSFSQKEKKIAHVHKKTIKDVLFLDEDIIEIEGDKRSVWKVVEGKAYKTKIAIGQRVFGDVVIIEGLFSGDIVIIEGQSILKDGDKLRVINKENGANS